ncbi:MAG TPA: hypothetical protein VMM38_15430 [Aridibacter sp.]|nr:hypothetical protein [Aridibacter sp.]
MPFFSAKCPVDEETKASIDGAFQWLLDEFGTQSFQRVEIIRPDNPAFPARISADDAAIHAFLRAVCGFMDVEYESVALRVFEDEGAEAFHPLAIPYSGGPKACGLYHWYAGKHEIAVDRKLLGSPVSLVATIAHELAHARLRSDLIAEEERESEELLTDYTCIFFGMGIFTANSVFSFDQFTNSQFQGWRASRHGYIDEESAGYALALFAYLKRDLKPVWIKFLETNPKYYFKQALRYLVKTGDCEIAITDQPDE